MALREKLGLIFRVKDSPHRISLAFAVGVFIGMSPFFGLHTVLGILIAYIFRLNKMVTIVGVYITNPWTIIPIYTFSTWIGARLLGINDIIPDINWNQITMSSLMHEFSPLLMPFVAGTIIVGMLSSVASYIIVYRAAKKRNG